MTLRLDQPTTATVHFMQARVSAFAARSLYAFTASLAMFTSSAGALAQPAPSAESAPDTPPPPKSPAVGAPEAPTSPNGANSSGASPSTPPAEPTALGAPEPATATAAEGEPAPVPSKGEASPSVSAIKVVAPPPKPETAAPAEPEAPLNALFDVALVVQTVWNTAPAYDYFSSDNQLLMGGITLGFDALQLTNDTVFSLDLTATTGETESEGPLPMFISQSSLRRTDLGLGIGVRHHVWYWLAPHLRFTGAAAFERASVASQDFVEPLEVQETNFVGSVGGGFTLYSAAKRISPTRSYLNSLAFRFTAEGGYQFAGGIPFEVAASTSPDGIVRAAIPLGELPQDGPFVRVTAGAHF